MIGMMGEHAQTFLLVFGIIGGIAFALPIFVAPLAWARVFRWNLPEDTDLAVYFGRCLGVMALVLDAFVLRAAVTGEGTVWVFRFAIAVFAGMTLVHIWGAIRRIQPMTETIEIAFWAGLVLLGLLHYPG